jgi:hypothetical protein
MKMKKSILLTLSAGMVLALSACTDAEMADFEHDLDQNMREVQDMQRDCKNYITDKVDLPMAAVHVSAGYGSNGRYTLPVRIKWDEPLVDERGECRVVNGRVRHYTITD